MTEGLMIERVNNGWILRWMIHESKLIHYTRPPGPFGEHSDEVIEGTAPDFDRGLVKGSAHVYTNAEKHMLLEQLVGFLNE